MPTILKMNDIPIIDYNSIIEFYDDEYLFEMILEYYTNTKQTDIFNFWKSRHSIDFEEDEDDVDDYNEDDNNMNLSLIKKYAPDIYNTYQYDIKDNENPFEMMYNQNLEVCANILKRRFTDKLYYDINRYEGAELSGDDTDTDE
jgi:hypothetical protein